MVTKAIIPVAGWGTRRLPITKVIEKCMLPIGNRPLVDYVVRDCLAAGITEIYFVVSEQSSQLQDYYRSNINLNDYLRRNGKEGMLPLIAPLAGVKLHYIVQPSYGRYGTAVPVALAVEQVPDDESVVVLMGDDFIYNTDGTSAVACLIAAADAGECAMLGVNVPAEEVPKYGVLEVDENNNFVQIVEKPTEEEAPSTMINVSKYLLNPQAIQAIRAYVHEERDGEYYITDPLNRYVAAGGALKVVPARGEYLDGGTVQGWLRANQIVLNSA